MQNRHSTNINGIVGKICNKCNMWYSLYSFCKNKRENDGLHYVCKNCCIKYNKSKKGRASYLKYRLSAKGRMNYNKASTKKYNDHRNIIARLKYNGCAICGYDRCPNALDFHHTNPEDKKFVLSVRSMGFKDSRIIDEINKCILLCCRCHREIEKEI